VVQFKSEQYWVSKEFQSYKKKRNSPFKKRGLLKWNKQVGVKYWIEVVDMLILRAYLDGNLHTNR